MSADHSTFMLVIDHGRAPDWAAMARMAETIAVVPAHAEAFEGFPVEDGTPDEQARQELVECVAEFRKAWNDGRGGLKYEIRRVRDADLHIAYDDADDPTELWHYGATLDHYDGLWTAAGFDNDRS